MRSIILKLIFVFFFTGLLYSADSINVVVITGGHGFPHDPFYSLFQGYSDISYVEAPQSGATEIFDDITDWPYDVIVFYNMMQEISETGKGNLLELLDRGVGIVGLHHNIACYLSWPEYGKIMGVRYYLEGYNTVGDTTYPLSTFREGVDINVHLEDPDHPILSGIEGDFVVHD